MALNDTFRTACSVAGAWEGTAFGIEIGCRCGVAAGVTGLVGLCGLMVGNGVGPVCAAGVLTFVKENGIDAAAFIALEEGACGVFTDEIEPRTGTLAGAARRGAAGCTGFVFPTKIETPCPGESNGLVISDGTSTCL